jgi:hypothetical protein
MGRREGIAERTARQGRSAAHNPRSVAAQSHEGEGTYFEGANLVDVVKSQNMAAAFDLLNGDGCTQTPRPQILTRPH